MTKPGIPLLACLLALPLPALAQDAAISGTVEDQTGGVLPGVTVEAAGPAYGKQLIEKQRLRFQWFQCNVHERQMRN